MESIAKSESGEPLVQYRIDKDGNLINKETPTTDTKENTKTVSPVNIEEEVKTMTAEEELDMQRDIAFRVVVFFISFIIACFGLLYVYHRIH